MSENPEPDTQDEGSPGGAQFDDPNRESIGLDPIWTEAENPPLPDGDDPEPEPEQAKKKSKKDDDEE